MRGGAAGGSGSRDDPTVGNEVLSTWHDIPRSDFFSLRA